MYLRFVVPNWKDKVSHQPVGIIRAAGRLKNHYSAFSTETDKELEKVFDWFNDFLPIPRKLSKSSKLYAENKATSWFKDSANSCINKARYLAKILESNGFQTEMLVSRSPGYIVYEDDWQVAVLPFRKAKHN